jgi:hypothetical protein
VSGEAVVATLLLSLECVLGIELTGTETNEVTKTQHATSMQETITRQSIATSKLHANVSKTGSKMYKDL